MCVHQPPDGPFAPSPTAMPDNEDSEPLSNNNNADNSPEVKDEAEEANIIQRRSRTTPENPTPRVRPEPKALEPEFERLERQQPDQTVEVQGNSVTVKPKGWHIDAANKRQRDNNLPVQSEGDFLKRTDIDKTRYFNEQERQEKKVTFTEITADEIKAQEEAALEPGKKLPQNYQAKPNVSLHHMQPQQQPAPVVQEPEANEPNIILPQAEVAAQQAADKAKKYGVKEVEVKVKGPGSGRESAITALEAAGLKVKSIEDVTPLPHNGCRPRKKRRV